MKRFDTSVYYTLFCCGISCFVCLPINKSFAIHKLIAAAAAFTAAAAAAMQSAH